MIFVETIESELVDPRLPAHERFHVNDPTERVH